LLSHARPAPFPFPLFLPPGPGAQLGLLVGGGSILFCKGLGGG